MPSLYIAFLIVHIFSAMFWVGGMIFYVIVIMSILRDSNFKDVKFLLLKKTALQFRKISYYVFFLFIFSGIGIFYSRRLHEQANELEFWYTGLGLLLSIKLGLFLLLLVSSLYHDFITGPRTFLYLETNKQLYEKYRKMSAFFGRVNLIVSAIIAVLGIFISRGYSPLF